MRRRDLPPAAPLRARVAVDEVRLEGGPSAAGVRSGVHPLEHDDLAAASPARPHPRALFDPARGWFRRLERAISLLLTRRVFPNLPGVRIPYTLQLDRWLTVSEAEILLEGLPPPFDGLRLLLISDIHSGPFLSPRCLERTLGRLGSLEADLILVAGDFASTRVGEFAPCVPALSRLSAPLGVFGVMGNHDHYTQDPARLAGLVEDGGVRLLRNEAVALERAGSRLILAGIDDLITGNADLDATLASAEALRREQPAEVILLLSHNPDIFFEAAERGVGLVLAGHTHGGQIRIPRLPVLVRMSRFRLDQGRYRAGGAELVVSRGLGVSGIPLRLGCPPEVVLLRLRRP